MPESESDLLYPAEAAAIFRVGVKTITRWAKEGRLPVATFTLGGHRRYSRAVCERLKREGLDRAW